MKKEVDILKLGASNDPYPLYANYLHVDNTFAETNNDKVFVHLDYDFSFEGNVNIFILSQILSHNDNPEITRKKDILEIKSDKTKHELVLMDVEFPSLPKPDVPMITLTKDMIDKIKIAGKFTGTDIYSYVYIGADFIYSTDKTTLYYSKYDKTINKGEPIGLNKQIIGLLNEGHTIGVHEGNVVLEIDNGYMIFVCDSMNEYPVDMMIDYCNNLKDGDKLCNVAFLRESLKVLSPIFYGEETQVSLIKNNNNGIQIIAECAVNGKADYKFDSEMEDEFEFNIDLNKFRDTPLDFNIFIDKNDFKQIVLKNDEDVIVIATCIV